MKTKRTRLIVIFVALVLLGATAFIGGRLLMPYTFHGAVFQSPMPANDFTLTSHMGQPLALNDLRGKLVLIYFGYTVCPDVCPTTLAEVHGALKRLGKDRDQVQVLMVTVDPERDTLPVLADYMTHFDPTFIGLRGTPTETAQVTTQFGIYYEKAASDSVLGYLVNHTATVLVIDRKGFLRLVFPYGTSAEAMAEDLRYLMWR